MDGSDKGQWNGFARSWLIAIAMCMTVVAALLFPRSSTARPAAGGPAAPAESSPAPAGSGEEEEGASPWQAGPAHLDLGHDVAIELPASYGFLPKEFAAKVLEANGSLFNENLLGIIAAADHEDDWFVVLRYDEEGYVKDDESVDADELLKSIREGNGEANEERKKRGFKALAIDGWSDPPRYSKTEHHLTWALFVSDPDGKSVNFNTRVLGRRGFVSVNLVTDPEKLAGFKHHAAAILGGTGFAKGGRYEDFDSSKDKVAEYGLAGLVMAGAGLGAAKLVKIGLLAKFWKVILAALIAGKKLVVVAAVAVGAYLKKLFGSKKGDQPAS